MLRIFTTPDLYRGLMADSENRPRVKLCEGNRIDVTMSKSSASDFGEFRCLTAIARKNFSLHQSFTLLGSTSDAQRIYGNLHIGKEALTSIYFRGPRRSSMASLSASL